MAATPQLATTSPPPHAAALRSFHRIPAHRLTSGIGLFFFPVFWMVLTSFKQEADAYTDPPTLFFEPTLDQFRNVFERGALPYFANSLFATVVSTLLVLLLAVPAAYALRSARCARPRTCCSSSSPRRCSRWSRSIVPLYVVAGELSMLDNIWMLVILYTAMNLPIAVWMMRSFLLEIPREVLEAAEVDGAPLPKLMREVMLPMVTPGLAATALICVIFAWNEFFFAVNLTAARAGTVPVFLVGFITSEGLYWAQLSAAATVASLPVILAGWMAQKQLVRGLSMGAVK